MFFYHAIVILLFFWGAVGVWRLVEFGHVIAIEIIVAAENDRMHFYFLCLTLTETMVSIVIL